MIKTKRMMTFLLLISLLLSGCRSLLSELDSSKSSDVEMTFYENIHVSWIDFLEENWPIHGYRNVDDWKNDIEYLNRNFQLNLKGYWLDNKNLSFSDNKNFTDYPAEGLLIALDEVFIDSNNYKLYLSIEFIDLKTNETLLKLKKRAYYGNQFGFTGYLTYALDEVSQRITLEILQKGKRNLLR